MSKPKYGIRVKLFALSLAPIALMAVLNLFGIWMMNSQSKDLEMIARDRFPKMVGMMTMRIELNSALRYMWSGFVVSDPKVRTERIETAEAKFKSFEDQIAKFGKLNLSEKMRSFLVGIDNSWAPVSKDDDKVAELLRKGDPVSISEAQSIMLNKIGPAVQKIVEEVEGAQALLESQVAENVRDAESDSVFAIRGQVTLAVLGGLFLLVFGFILSRSLVTGFGKVAQLIGLVSSDVQGTTDQVSTGAKSLAASATQQAAALQETVSSLEEINATVRKNAENAEQSQVSSEQCFAAAQKGKESVGDVLKAIEEMSQANTEVTQQVENSNQEIEKIAKYISEIGNKTKIINDIVFQTKLLSFNASVEAARAGEHGKGFAVVAEEVGNLAVMSGRASQEISQMLTESISSVDKIVADTQQRVRHLVEQGRRKVEQGTATVRNCETVLEEIVTASSAVKQRVSEIATASQEQAKGVDEITRAMNELDEATQRSTAISQENSKSASDLYSGATALNKAAIELSELVHGAAGAPAEQARAAQKPIDSPVPSEEPQSVSTDDSRFAA